MDNNIKITCKDSYAEFDSRGAYLKSLVLNGKKIIKESNDKISTHGGAAVLMPFANRIRNAEYSYNGKHYNLPENDGNNSIHGLVRDIQFDYILNEKSVKFTTTLDSKYYPGKANITLKYTIENNSFITEASIKSLDSKIPVEIGFHPYFYAEPPYKIYYDSELKKLEYTDNYFPDGKLINENLNNIDLSKMDLDNAFIAENKAITLKYANTSIKITRKNMHYIVLYNGLYTEKKSIAIEPMTGAPDVFHNHMGLIELDKGQTFECSYSITLE